MSIDSATLAEALTSLELRELPLLRWGLTDGVLSDSEVHEILSSTGGPNSVEELLSELLEHRLIFEVPTFAGSDQVGYRTRMAESVRLMKHLRQTFRSEASWQGRELIADFHLVHRPRVRPRRDHSSNQLFQEASGFLTPVGLATLSRIIPDTVSAFQIRSTSAVLRSLTKNDDGGVMISAGTGAGKTIAFYGPALAHVAEEINRDPSGTVKVLAIYPRGELLKDQFSNLARLAWAIGQGNGVRPIRIGCWFTPTPYAPAYVDSKVWAESVTPSGRVHPFLTCPGVDCGADLVWPTQDLDAGRERLVCAESCGVELDDRHVALTRRSLRANPPDVMMTTTESLNRQIADADQLRTFGLGGRGPSLILLDEIHTYEGTQGAQTAILMRRLRRLIPNDSNVTYVGLSATLENAAEFLSDFVHVPEPLIELVEPLSSLDGSSEMEEVGAEYLVALRHNPAEPTSVLSATIQTAMLAARTLDGRAASPYDPDPPSSSGLYGQRTFLFTDKLDVTNRLYWDLLDAEGWWEPGRLNRRHRPASLGHLRSRDQNFLQPAIQEPAADRDPTGQWWWLPESLGHLLEDDRQLRVSRTSSQDAGVAEDSDVIVATASLEVGYDDDRVGAVIQHKAPNDAARFIQRRGRAGRRMEMRPWTIVVLSDWGRDRLAWESPERLFDPELTRRTLPLRNRHVLKMQAVYATLDWLSERVSNVPARSSTTVSRSTWSDLTGPADVVETKPDRAQARRQRQEAIAELLRRILLDGPERGHLRAYLRKALGFANGDEGERELDAIFWSPPRNLLTAVIPTALRRLETEWAGEVPTGDDSAVRYRRPLPEFVVGNLFGSLLLPETEVVPDPGSPDGVEYLPTVRTLSEFLPGNVTRHFGHRTMERRHWVPLPSMPSGGGTTAIQIDALSTYNGVPIGRIQDATTGAIVDLYQPTRVELAAPPPNLQDASTVRPDWKVDLEELGEPIDMAIGGAWADLIPEMTGFLLEQGSGVSVRRYATNARGQVGNEFPLESVAIEFTDGQPLDGRSVGLGFQYETNGIHLTVQCPDEWEPSPRERTDWVRHLFEVSSELPENLNAFDRRTLISGALVAAGRSDKPISAISDEALADQITSALQDLGKFKPEFDDWLASAAVLRLARDVLIAGWSTPDDSWRAWRRRRLGGTVAACVIHAGARDHPELDTEDLVIDVVADCDKTGRTQIWITEQTAGGNGQIDLLVRSAREDRRQFRKRMSAELAPRGDETSGQQVTQLLNLMLDNDRAFELSGDMQRAWGRGHTDASSAFLALREYATSVGVAAGRDAWSIVGSRLLGPGTTSSHLELARRLDESRLVLEARSSVLLQVAETAAVLAADPEIEVRMSSTAPTAAARVQAINRLLWGHSVESNFGDDSFNRFGLLPPLDRQALRTLLSDRDHEISFSGNFSEDVGRIRESLRREGEVVVHFGPETAAQVRGVLLEMQQTPVQGDFIHVHPVVTGTDDSNPGHLRITLTIPEFW